MPDETETAPGATETPAPPMPAFSAPASESAGASPALDYDQIAERLSPKLSKLIEDTVAKSFQSGKDVRFAAVDKIKKYLDAAGGDPAKATRDMALDEFMAQQASGAGAGRALPTETPDQARTKIAQEVGELLTEAGIPYDDPEYVALVGRQHASPEHFRSNVTRLIAKRAKQARQPGAATAVADGGGAPAGAQTREEKLTRATAKLQALNPARQPKEFAAAKLELEALIRGA